MITISLFLAASSTSTALTLFVVANSFKDAAPLELLIETS